MHTNLNDYGVIWRPRSADKSDLWRATFTVGDLAREAATLYFDEEPEHRAIEAICGHYGADACHVTPPAPPVDEPPLLFFYGTLMSDHQRGGILSNAGVAKPIGRGTIRGQLHAVGQMFPAYLEGDGLIYGEVWRPHSSAALAEALRITDSIEGYRASSPRTSMYVRQTVDLLSFDGDGEPPTRVQTYRWNSTVPGPRIVDGSWTSFVEQDRQVVA